MTDLKLRDAFDSDSVPLKNIALKKAYIRMDELEGALERANATTEEYERKFYLGTDRIEELQAALREYRNDLCEYPSGDLCGKLNEEVCQGCAAASALAGEKK